MNALISVQDVSFHYRSEHQVLDGINLQIAPYTSVALVGPSGSGKTTLLSLIGGIISPVSGTIEFSTQPAKDGWITHTALQHETFWVMQSPNLFTELTVHENLQLALLATNERSRVPIDAALALVNMEKFADRKVSTLSGGQAQRIAVARALATKRSIILADEPTASLDQSNALMVGNALHMLTQFGKTIIVATHDPQVAALCDEQISLTDGKIASWRRKSDASL